MTANSYMEGDLRALKVEEGFSVRKTESTGGYECGFHFKDFRLVRAGRITRDEIKKLKPPKTGRELRAKMMMIANAVAKALNTAPCVALSSYIDPDLWKKWRISSKALGKSPSWSAVAAKAEKVENLLADRFRARWSAVGKELAKGIDVAKNRAPFFVASDSRTRLRLARRYYSPARAKRFASASAAEIAQLCWPWFNPFQLFVYSSGNGLPEIGRHLEELVRSEYIALTWELFATLPTDGIGPRDYDSPEHAFDGDSPRIYPLSNPTTKYGDVYEAIVYSYSGERLRVCKSVAEPFSRIECSQAMDEIEKALLEAAAEEGDDPRTWKVCFLPPPRRAWVIDAHIFGDAGSPRQRSDFSILRDELTTNRSDYLKRLQPSIRWRQPRRKPIRANKSVDAGSGPPLAS